MPDLEAQSTALRRTAANLQRFTIAWNTAEAIVSVSAGVAAGSIALLGFGFDSLIEIASATAAWWRVSSKTSSQRDSRERISLRLIGACFLVLAFYVSIDSGLTLWKHREPSRSILGLLMTAASAVVMPLLSARKRKVAAALHSRAVRADAAQTQFCTYFSIFVLIGLLLNALFGWWWADPLAALALVPFLTKEAIEALHHDSRPS